MQFMKYVTMSFCVYVCGISCCYGKILTEVLKNLPVKRQSTYDIIAVVKLTIFYGPHHTVSFHPDECTSGRS